MTKTTLLIITLFIITCGLLWLALSQNNQNNLIVNTPTPTIDPIQTVLTISSPIEQASPSSYLSDVLIETGQNKVNSIQLELSYDPKVLTNVNITEGNFFANSQVKIKNIDQESGRISFVLNALGPAGVDNGVLGQGTVAHIQFATPKGLKQTNTFIKFEPKTQVLGFGIANSLLKTSVNANFTIGITPSLTPTPIATASAN